MVVRRKRPVVTVHLKSGESIEGALGGRERGHYVLLAARLLKAENETVALTGDIIIPRENVRFIQR